MESLADFLGVRVEKDGDKVSRAGISVSNPEALVKLTGREFALAVLESPEFRQYIVAGLILGDLPPAIVCRLIDHGWGKPPDRLEVRDVTNDVDEMNLQELEEEIVRLHRISKQLREAPVNDGIVH